MLKSNPANPSLTGLYVRNFSANIAGNLVLVLLNIFTPLEFFKEWQNFLRQGGWILLVSLVPMVFISAGLLQFLIQRPISGLLKQVHFGEAVEKDLILRAKRRLLNLPLSLAISNLILWISVTVLFTPVLHFLRQFETIIGVYLFFRTIIIGLIAAFISFFLVDDYSRKNLVPLFFPEGRLASTPGTIRISILRRIRVLYAAGTGAPVLILVGTLGLLLWEMQDSLVSAVEFGKEIFIFIIVLYVIFVIIAVSFNYLVGKSILRPIQDMMKLVKKIREGNLRQKVRVVSNDELGILGDGLNEMTRGLMERERLQQSLNLAREVQQALLPRGNPNTSGLDIAAQTVYCDETGGDYYDFINTEESGRNKLNVIVGDVSGHGIAAALLMATGRALLRQRTILPGSISTIVRDVNRQLCRDFEEPGGFMTLFYLTVDPYGKSLKWVRAGHDPAFFYDAVNDSFEDLRGKGMALGVDEHHKYTEYSKHGLAAGQIIVLGTDGIWETYNSTGEMYGKNHLSRIIRKYCDLDAKGILTACLYNLEKFRNGQAPEDDITLIVIKIEGDGL